MTAQLALVALAAFWIAVVVVDHRRRRRPREMIDLATEMIPLREAVALIGARPMTLRYWAYVERVPAIRDAGSGTILFWKDKLLDQRRLSDDRTFGQSIGRFVADMANVLLGG
jgi:hypothetical protein